MHAKKLIHWKYMKHRKQIYIVIRLRYFSSSTCLYPMSMTGLWFDCQLYTVGIFYPCSFTIRLCDHKKDMERLMLVHLKKKQCRCLSLWFNNCVGDNVRVVQLSHRVLTESDCRWRPWSLVSPQANTTGECSYSIYSSIGRPTTNKWTMPLYFIIWKCDYEPRWLFANMSNAIT